MTWVSEEADMRPKRPAICPAGEASSCGQRAKQIEIHLENPCSGCRCFPGAPLALPLAPFISLLFAGVLLLLLLLLLLAAAA